MLGLIVDRNHFIGMQTQIASQIATLIRNGTILPGEALPSETKLAGHYGVSRNVVREAYQILKNKKLIKSDSRSKGSIVREASERSLAFEHLRIQLPFELKERIDVVSLMEDMPPHKFLELELRAKVNQLFDEYRNEYQKRSDCKSPLKSCTDDAIEGKE